MNDKEIRALAIQAADKFQLAHKVKLTPTRRENFIANFILGFRESYPEGMKAGRERIAAIVALPEATQRQDAALKIALETDLTVEQARAVLATAPEIPAEASGLPFGRVAESATRADALANVNRVMSAAGFTSQAD